MKKLILKLSCDVRCDLRFGPVAVANSTLL